LDNFNNYLEAVVDYQEEHEELRLGQCVIIILQEWNKKLFDDIYNTALDCFYDSTKINDCLKYIKNNWRKDTQQYKICHHCGTLNLGINYLCNSCGGLL